MLPKIVARVRGTKVNKHDTDRKSPKLLKRLHIKTSAGVIGFCKAAERRLTAGRFEGCGDNSGK
jgi:hypothetical protein